MNTLLRPHSTFLFFIWLDLSQARRACSVILEIMSNISGAFHVGVLSCELAPSRAWATRN